MLGTLATLFVGLIGGISVGLQSSIVGQMSQRVGGVAGSFIVHVSGTILSGALLLARGGENIGQWRGLPWYMLASGIFGLILYLTLTHTLPRLGAAGAFTCIIVGQLLAGVAIDHFGWFGAVVRPVDLTRLTGAAIVLAGAYLVVRQ